MLQIDVSDAGEWRVTGEANLHHAVDFRRKLVESLEKGAPRVVRLDGLTDLDTAGAQVLLSLRRTVPGLELRLDGAPKAVLDYLRDTGLAGALGVK